MTAKHNIEERRAELERRAEVDALLSMSPDIKRLVELLQSIEKALVVFAKIGEVLIWMAKVAVAIGALWAATKAIMVRI